MTAANGSTTAQQLVTATNPDKAPFIHMSNEKLGSPVRRSSKYKLVNKAEIPPAAPDSAVLTAEMAATLPAMGISNSKADPELNPNPTGNAKRMPQQREQKHKTKQNKRNQ